MNRQNNGLTVKIFYGLKKLSKCSSFNGHCHVKFDGFILNRKSIQTIFAKICLKVKTCVGISC